MNNVNAARPQVVLDVEVPRGLKAFEATMRESDNNKAVFHLAGELFKASSWALQAAGQTGKAIGGSLRCAAGFMGSVTAGYALTDFLGSAASAMVAGHKVLSGRLEGKSDEKKIAAWVAAAANGALAFAEGVGAAAFLLGSVAVGIEVAALVALVLGAFALVGLEYQRQVHKYAKATDLKYGQNPVGDAGERDRKIAKLDVKAQSSSLGKWRFLMLGGHGVAVLAAKLAMPVVAGTASAVAGPLLAGFFALGLGIQYLNRTSAKTEHVQVDRDCLQVTKEQVLAGWPQVGDGGVTAHPARAKKEGSRFVAFNNGLGLHQGNTAAGMKTDRGIIGTVGSIAYEVSRAVTGTYQKLASDISKSFGSIAGRMNPAPAELLVNSTKLVGTLTSGKVLKEHKVDATHQTLKVMTDGSAVAMGLVKAGVFAVTAPIFRGMEIVKGGSDLAAAAIQVGRNFYATPKAVCLRATVSTKTALEQATLALQDAQGLEDIAGLFDKVPGEPGAGPVDDQAEANERIAQLNEGVKKAKNDVKRAKARVRGADNRQTALNKARASVTTATVAGDNWKLLLAGSGFVNVFSAGLKNFSGLLLGVRLTMIVAGLGMTYARLLQFIRQQRMPADEVKGRIIA
ncbi:MAG: hypothetical protein ACOYKZ_02590 [Chlamydiia bacterium]